MNTSNIQIWKLHVYTLMSVAKCGHFFSLERFFRVFAYFPVYSDWVGNCVSCQKKTHTHAEENTNNLKWAPVCKANFSRKSKLQLTNTKFENCGGKNVSFSTFDNDFNDLWPSRFMHVYKIPNLFCTQKRKSELSEKNLFWIGICLYIMHVLDNYIFGISPQ